MIYVIEGNGTLTKKDETIHFEKGEIYFDEYKEGVITIYGITNEVIEKAKCNIHSSAIMLLESKEYISIFNYFIKQQTCIIHQISR